MRRKPPPKRSEGFTLLEALAALAITAVIIVATVALMRNVAFYFDRGTRGVTQAEGLMLAVDRLAGDFASARFILQTAQTGAAAAAFLGKPASDQTPAKIAFVGAAGVGSQALQEELIDLTVERDGDVARLVRRRARWPGPQARFEDLQPQDAVVLIEGKVDMAFVFGYLAPDEALRWSESWIAQPALPRFVRLLLRDSASGADLLPETDFVVRSDAPFACGYPEAVPSCLLSAGPPQTRSAQSDSGSASR